MHRHEIAASRSASFNRAIPTLSYPNGMVPRPVGRHASQTGATFSMVSDLASGSARGIPIAGGAEEGGVWLLSADQHTSVSGRTGSGKTTSVALTAIALEARSKVGEKRNLLVVDAKSGVYEETRELVKEAGYDVRCLDLRTGVGDRVDLLGEACDTLELDAFERFASDVFDRVSDTVSSDKDPYWKYAVRDLATAVACSMAACGLRPTLPNVGKVVTSTDAVKDLLLQSKRGPFESLLRAATSPMRATETWACIQGCASSCFDFYLTGAGREAAGASNSFALGPSLRSRDGMPLAFYIIAPDESRAGDRFASLVFDYAYNTVVDASETGLPPRGLQVHIDEAARFPTSCLPQLLGAGRSRNVFAHLYYQQAKQFCKAYTKEEVSVMLSQMGAIVHLSSSDAEEATRLEQSTGCRAVLSTLAQLPVGDALVESKGHPVVRTHIPQFEELLQCGAFGKQ